MICVRLLAALATLALASCVTTTVTSSYPPTVQPAAPHKIFIAVDGTGGDLIGRSNATQLFELVANQDRPNLSVFYTEGVGTHNNLAGSALGVGLSKDVRRAYRFLAENWSPGAQLYLAGLSRGAFTVRALAGMVAVAGITDFSGLDAKQREQRVERLFNAYASHRLRDETREHQFARLSGRVAALGYPQRAPGADVKFRAVALWDTVAALWAPDRSDNPFEQEPWFVISNCNFDSVFQALSIDDNRAYSFTPITLLRSKPDPLCPDWRPRVEEAWFAGAHADVGGSYAVNEAVDGFLEGVSMRWMLSRLRGEDILPPSASIYADSDGPIHNAKAWNPAYHFLYVRWRDPFFLAEESHYGGGKPVLHRSVLDRLKHVKLLDDRFPACRDRNIKPALICSADLKRMTFLSQAIDRKCLLPTAEGYELNPDRDCFAIIDDTSYFDPSSGSWRQTVEPRSL